MRFRFSSTALCILLLVVTQGCKTNEATGRTQFNFMSMDQQVALGAEAAPELVNEYGGEVESEELRDYVSRIGGRMARKVEGSYRSLEWRFYVLDSEIINAFALPGGRVFISRGLMSYMNNEAQLAAVLGHEIGHVTAEHTGERLSAATGLQTAAAAGGYVLGDTGTAELVNLVVGAGGQGFLLKFGRDQESEADRLGLRYMTNVGYDPRGMVQLLQILIDTSGGSRSPEILSTHPDPTRRKAEAQTLIASEYGQTRRNSRFDLHERRFRRDAAPHLPPPAQAMNGDFIPLARATWCAHCNTEADQGGPTG